MSFFADAFGGGSKPKVITPPSASSKEVQQKVGAQRQRLALNRGRKSTILSELLPPGSPLKQQTGA